MHPKIRFFLQKTISLHVENKPFGATLETHYKLQRCYSNALEFNKVMTLSKIVLKYKEATKIPVQTVH